MRIAVYHNLPSGGAKRTLFEILKHLSPRHQFDVYSTSLADQVYSNLQTYAQINKIYPFSTGKLFNSPMGRLNMLVRYQDLNRIQDVNGAIAHEVELGKYDVLFVNPCQIEIAPSVLRFVKKIPKIYYCHEPPRILYESMPCRPYNDKSPLGKLADQIDPFPGRYFNRLKKNDHENTQKADLVLANSEFAQATVKTIYDKAPRVAYPGVDASIFRPLDVQKERAVLSVGSLTPLKNFDFIIQSLARISNDIRPPLWLVSNFQNPPEYDYLNHLAEQSGVQVHFLGNVSDQELVEFYNRAAVTVYTPIREPFGLVPLESMACETPVITIREGGMQETVQDGITGWLVDRDLEGLAEKIMFALDHGNLVAQMGKNGRQIVLNQWTWDRVTARFEDYFYSVSRMN